MNTEKQRCPKELCIEKYFGRQFNEKDKIDTDFGLLTDLLDSYEQQIRSNPSEFGLVKQEAASVKLYQKALDENTKLKEEIETLKQALHRDETGLAKSLADVKATLESYHWLTEGRGPYEWDDDRYKAEVLTMLETLGNIVNHGLSESGIRSHAYCCKRSETYEELQSENDRLKAEILRLHEQQLDVDWEIEADEAGLDKETQEEIIKWADETCRKAEEEDERVRNLELENIKLKEALSELTVAARTISEDHAYMVYDAVDEDFKLEREVLRSQIEKDQAALQSTKI